VDAPRTVGVAPELDTAGQIEGESLDV